jgi:hypothetical protein
MATTVLTGRGVALTYATVNYDDQLVSATVTLDDATATLQTLNGLVDYQVDNEIGTLDLEIIQDWGAATSLCDTLWTDADTASTVTKAVTVGLGGKTITLSVLPKRPNFGGSAPDALTTTVSLPIRSVSKS